MALTADQIRRYARHILLANVGGTGQARLLAATVRLEEAGGAGAAALVYLAAAGVGTIVVADRGVVAPEDRWLYERADVGRPRLEAARERVAALNPDVRVVAEGPGRELPLAAGPIADPIEQLARGARAAARAIEELAA